MAILGGTNRGTYMSTKAINTLALGLIAAAAGLLSYGNLKPTAALALLNVSYDPTREVYSEINPKFVAQFQKDSGTSIDVKQSHGGSTRQAKAVADGLAADVVTLGLPSDIESLHKFGLVAEDWQKQFPTTPNPIPRPSFSSCEKEIRTISTIGPTSPRQEL